MEQRSLRRGAGSARRAAGSAGAARPTREQQIRRHRNLIYSALRRLGCGGDEDMVQVATLGLLKAIDRFDPTRGFRFSTYAMPTIEGEVKRYLRDRTRTVRPPRGLLELRHAVLAQKELLTARLERSPTPSELAEALDAELDDVIDALALEEICHPCSLDSPIATCAGTHPLTLSESIGEEDQGYTRVENRVVLREAIAELEPRLRKVVALRFYEELSQSQTAERLGVSQMQISRLERQALARLRDYLAFQ